MIGAERAIRREAHKCSLGKGFGAMEVDWFFCRAGVRWFNYMAFEGDSESNM